ncbi:ankyrin repeat domain-containing protein [Ruegeria sp. HKCCA5426]|uniref:ankyrin repeat domain-containing protein n=1 Tax=Ruegeria sp. HKCCA5426 TaxID=2682985 RepID=UPI001487927A|nr:hypothetical protein [Ruegeria sp. HKCCA5426]
MDILSIQQLISDFLISQITDGSGNTEDVKALRAELDAAIAKYGDTIPELGQLAAQFDLLNEKSFSQDLANQFAEKAVKEHVPEPLIFDAISDGDLGAVADALDHWEINATHGELEATALYMAMSCMFGVSLEVVRLLLDRGADPKLGLGSDYNVLHGLGFGNCDAIEPNELTEVIKRCMALGADIEQRSKNLQWTPLITAASEWNPVVVEALILAGVDIHSRSGKVSDVCLAGETGRSFAEGHAPTLAVFDRYMTET